jgi:uncharacterized membrane-anchored protein YitT (DUF2179 family)
MQDALLATGKKFFTKDFIPMNLGIFLVSLGIHVFKNPNRFASGGISGLSLLLSHLIQIPVGSLMLVLNIVVLVLGYVILGKESSVKAVYGSMMVSLILWVLEIAMPLSAPLTQEKFLELIFSVFVPGFGSALVFHHGGSTGGTDTIAQILKKLFRIKLSVGLLLTDFFIAAGAGFLFGMEACLYSILGVCLKTFLLDSVLENLRIFKIMVIISEKSKDIYHYIINDLHRGATIHMAQGAYTVQTKEVITTVLSRRQAHQLQQFIKGTDPMAFITVSNSSEIIGKGFEGFE